MSAWIGKTFPVRAALALSSLGVGLGVAAAQPASTPVTQCGQVLAAPGHYHLAQDLGPCPGDGVLIAASNVRFTLAGHTLSGVSTQASCDLDNPQYGVSIATDARGVRVSGGTIRGFVDGIVHYGSRSRVTGMTVADNCLFGIVVSGTGNRVDTSRVTGSDDGIALCEAQQAVVEANEVFGNFRYAVILSCGDGSNQNRVVRNILHGNGLPAGDGGGVAIFNGSENRIVGNAVNGNWDGIWLSAATGTVVRDNTVNGNLSIGIAVSGSSPGNTLRGNTAYGNALFDLSDDNPPGVNTWLANLYGTSHF
jgi:parallel beta-helix repeat protein